MSKEPLRAFRVTLRLWEKDTNLGEWEKADAEPITILTFETGFESARKLAESSYMEADATDREEFEWRSSAIEEVDERFTIPKTDKVLPRE
jgi:hypothetical protein